MKCPSSIHIIVGDLQKLVHVLVMSGYKEPMEVILATLDSFKAQTVARQLFVVVGLEEKTPDYEVKKAAFLARYQGIFRHIMVTQHPSGVDGEIPGKCSNVNYAARLAVEELKDMSLYNTDRCIITTCDTDNPFPPKYFEYLGFDFLRREDRMEVVWQASPDETVATITMDFTLYILHFTLAGAAYLSAAFLLWWGQYSPRSHMWSATSVSYN